jgi:hypothetical protein
VNFETTEGQAALVDAIFNMVNVTSFLQIIATTPFNFPAVPGATSVTPAWRDSVWHVRVASFRLVLLDDFFPRVRSSSPMVGSLILRSRIKKQQ